MKYGVTLNNDSAIFDSREDFDTLREAVEWALGRGSKYNIQIDDGTYPGYHLSVADGQLWYERNYHDWVKVSVDSFCDMHE